MAKIPNQSSVPKAYRALINGRSDGLFQRMLAGIRSCEPPPQ